MSSRLPLVISIAALVVAVLGATPLGQAAYNAVVPNNSVGTNQLRNLSVTRTKIRGDAVDSGKVKDHSLKAIDFAQGQLPAGPAGAKGDKGSKGNSGDPGLSGYEIVRASVSVPPNTLSSAQAACPVGKKVIGGAGSIQTIPAGVWLSTGITSDRYYDAYALNTTAVARQVNAVAICAKVTP